MLAELEPELGHRWAMWMLILSLIAVGVLVLLVIATLLRRRIARRQAEERPARSDLTLDAWAEAGRRVSEGPLDDEDLSDEQQRPLT